MIRAAIDQINEEIQSLVRERENLQKVCKHASQKKVEYMDRPGSIRTVNICVKCDTVIENKSYIVKGPV